MDDFKEIYSRYKESGLTIKDFCSNERIKRKRFGIWKKKLERTNTNTSVGGPVLSGKTPASFFSHNFISFGQPQSTCEIVYSNGATVRLNGPVSSEIYFTGPYIFKP